VLGGRGVGNEWGIAAIFARRRLFVLLSALFAGLALWAPVAARALSYGLMWSGNLPQSELVSEINRVQSSGATSFRLEINWNRESNEGWGRYDEVFRLASERGITVLPYLYGRPASSGAEEKWFPVGEPATANWEAFVKAAVHRYGQGGEFWVGRTNPHPATAWEVWNEPNISTNNPGGDYAKPEAFASFLIATSAAIQSEAKKTGGAETLVLPGGLLSVTEASFMKEGKTLYSKMGVSRFLERASAVSGFGASFGALSLHPYAIANGPLKVEERIEEAHAAMKSKSIWITELGWPVAGEGLESGITGVTEAQQSEYLTSVGGWIKSNASSQNISALYWYNLRNGSSPLWAYHCGLARENGSLRPAWAAFSALAGGSGVPAGVWPSDELGGVITADPSISSRGEHLDVFGRGADNALWHKSYNAGGWTSWESLGGILSSGVGSVSWGGERVDAVALGADKAVWHWWWNGLSWQSESLGGTLASDPEISSLYSGQLDVWARGADNALWHKSYGSGSWGSWESLGGTMASGPGAISEGESRTDVVYLNPDHSVEHRWWNGEWHEENLGGYGTSDPDISSWGTGRLDVFIRGADEALWHKTFSGGAWSGWEELGGLAASGPSATSMHGNRIDLVATHPNGGVWHPYWNGP
jgi:hypothetical protein